MIEEWRDIEGYEGYYQVSNLGRVRSVDRFDDRGFHQRSCILKSTDNGKGYRTVGLTKKAKGKRVRVHRLVAHAFIPNPDNKPYVNHKDETRDNNNVDNLEWVTHKENINYGTHNDRVAKANSIPIKVIYPDNTYEYWESATIFARENGLKQANISSALLGKVKKAYGLKIEHAKKEG